MLIMTIDTDWVPAFVLEHTLSLLDMHKVRATIFCTSAYAHPLLEQHELALHPNLMSDATQGEDELSRLQAVQHTYPQAVGVRTHRLYWHAGLHRLFLQAGLKYDASLFCPLQPGLTAYNEVGLLRFPLWWVDNFHARMGLDFDKFAPPGLKEAGLKVLLFHPLQMYLNTRSLAETKTLLGTTPLPLQQESVLAARRKAGVGFETLFLAALKCFPAHASQTLSDILPQWSSAHAHHSPACA